MKKAILLVCVLALLVSASAAMAGDGSRVFLAFKAGWATGTTTAANATVSFGAAPTPASSVASIGASSYNIAATNGSAAWITQKQAANVGGYSFTLVVAPGTGATVTDHIGDAHEGMLYISAWNMESWSGTTGMTLPDNWQVTVTGLGIVGGPVTWTKADLFKTTAPATTIVGPVGFWYDYSNHYADFGSAITAGELLTVTVGPGQTPETPEPGSLLALGSGLVGMFGFAIRRRRA